MKTYRIYATVSGGKFIGEVQANSAEEAVKLGWDLEETYICLCHQCARECEDAEITELTAEE